MEDDRIVGYDTRPLTATSRTFPIAWGPFAWIALALFFGFVTMCFWAL